MKNNRGFTLIELLAVVVILGVIMMIAIPNTVSLIDKNKKSSYIENAKTFVSLVQSKVRTDKNLQLPTNTSSALVITLEYLNTSDVEENPYGEMYDKKASFVAITFSSSKYNYYVHLVSCIAKTSCDKGNANSWRGIELVELSRLNDDDRFNLIKSSGVNANLINNLSANTHLNGKSIYLNDSTVPM